MMKKIAMLLSCDAFEDFFGKTFGLDQERYLQQYRNDFAWEYAAGLRENQIDAILYVPSFNYAGLHETEDGFKVRFIPLAPWYKVAQKLFSKLKRLAIVTYFSELANTTAFADSLADAIKTDHVSLLYIQEFWTTRFDLLVNKIQIPIIAAGHGAKDTFVKPAQKQKSLPKAYKIICQSREELEKVTQYGGDAVLLPNAVDTEFYQPVSLSDRQEKRILTVARLEDRQKRTSDLLQALTDLDSDWVLEIVGTGPDLKFLKAEAIKLQVHDRVRFSGFIMDKTELREKYQQCRVFVLPSAWEAVALALLEAMSCGCAVVVTDIDAFKELVINEVSGFRVPVGDPGAIARAILQCDQNGDRLGEKARTLVIRSHSKKQMFSELATVIRSCDDSITALRFPAYSAQGGH